MKMRSLERFRLLLSAVVLLSVTPTHHLWASDDPQSRNDVASASERNGSNSSLLASTDPISPNAAVPPSACTPQLYSSDTFVTIVGNGFNGSDTSVIDASHDSFGLNGNNAFNFHLADDFTVSGSWTPTALTFYAYQTGTYSFPPTSTLTGIPVLALWDGVPGGGGTVIAGPVAGTGFSTGWTNTHRVTSSTLTNANRPIMYANVVWPASFPTTLSSGTYWLEWSFTGSLGSLFVPPANLHGTDNARQFDGTNWIDADMNSTVAGAQHVDFPMAVCGTTTTAPPTVTSISPNVGPTAGGTNLTITGANFSGATAVNFGAAPATFTVNDPTSISATAPAGTGTVDVVVTTAGGTSATSAADQFTFSDPPTVTNISPSYGPDAGGTSVTITGTNFDNATAVNFGATPAPLFTVNDSTSISATAPAGTGTVDVVVTTAGGTSATSAADQFTYRTTSSVALTTNCPSVFVAGQTFSATVAVTGSVPTGNVDFLAGGNGISGCTGIVLNAASASCATSNLPIGQGAMTATYGGDANNFPSASAGLDLTILDPADVIWRNTFEEAVVGCPTE